MFCNVSSVDRNAHNVTSCTVIHEGLLPSGGSVSENFTIISPSLSTVKVIEWSISSQTGEILGAGSYTTLFYAIKFRML